MLGSGLLLVTYFRHYTCIWGKKKKKCHAAYIYIYISICVCVRRCMSVCRCGRGAVLVGPPLDHFVHPLRALQLDDLGQLVQPLEQAVFIDDGGLHEPVQQLQDEEAVRVHYALRVRRVAPVLEVFQVVFEVGRLPDLLLGEQVRYVLDVCQGLDELEFDLEPGGQRVLVRGGGRCRAAGVVVGVWHGGGREASFLQRAADLGLLPLAFFFPFPSLRTR